MAVEFEPLAAKLKNNCAIHTATPVTNHVAKTDLHFTYKQFELIAKRISVFQLFNLIKNIYS